MSVILKSRRVKFRNTGSEGYQGINAISEEKTADVLQQIEQKGQEVKDSIPNDYTELAEQVNDLKADLSDNLDFIYSSHYSKSNLALNSATVSRGIANSGAVVYDTDKTLSFYPVSAGDIVYLSLSGNTGTSTAVWEFTNVGQASSLSANNVVGSTHFDAINGNVTVPTGAMYIAIAQATGSTYIIQKLIPVDYQGEIHDIKKGAYEHIVGDFERGSILNGVNSTTTTRVRHIKPVSYSHDIFLFVKSGFKYYVAFYSDAAGTTYLYTREFVSDNLPIIIKANTYFRMVICKTTEETVTDINTYIDALYITTQLFSNPQIYKNNLVRQVAHQGLSSNPASTTGYCMVESYVNAARAGFTHGELDIVFSYDSVPFCCHDATFTDATTSETVTIASKTAEELKAYNYHGGKIATFDEVVKTCKTYGMGVYVDHLDGSWTSDQWNSLFAVIQKYNMAKNTFWLLPAVAPLLTNPITTWYADANFVTVFTTAPSNFPTSVAAVEALKTDANIVSIDLPASAVSANDMPTYAAQIPPGIELEVWTVDTVANWYSYLPYVSAITSNRICANIARQLI